MSAKGTIPRRQTEQEQNHEQGLGGRGSGSVLRVLLMRTRALVPALGIFLLAGWLVSQSRPPRQTVGPTPDGGFLLNSGWKITPAGRQVPLDTFPMSSILS